MQRDMDLIRQMVLAAEAHPNGFVGKLEIAGYTEEQIGYHAYLLDDSGPAVGGKRTTLRFTSPDYIIRHLTSSGHDFAESSRSEYIWDEVREDIKKKGLASASIDVIKKLLDKQIRKRLEAD